MLENSTALMLINGLIGGSLVLLAGGVLSLLIREPVYRLRLTGVTLLATVVAVGMSALPGMPRWSLLTSAQQEAVQTAVAMPGIQPVADAGSAAPVRGVAADTVPSSAVAPVSMELVASSPLSLYGSEPEPGTSFRRARDGMAGPAGSMVSQFSSPALPPDFLPQLMRVFATGYVLSVAALVLWWAIGVFLLIRMIRAARPADDVAQALLRETAGEASDSVRLVISNRVRQPIACRAYGRVIMLPESLAEKGSRQELRFAIAHEWSHIERGDWWLWSLANLLRAAFLFHPAAWWLRRQVRLCQDFLADARAADQPGCRIDYAEFLTKQATVRRQPVLAAGLGMRGRRSELYQRVLLLVKRERPIETQCSHRWAWATLIVFLGVGIVAGSGQVFTGEARQADSDADPSTGIAEGVKAGIDDSDSASRGESSSASQESNSGEVLSEGELQVQFEDQNESLCFQLTAVSEPGGARSSWWEPNGKPLKQSSLQRWLSAESMPARNPDANHRVFLLQFWKHDRVSVRWLIDGVATTLLSSESVEIGDRRLTTVMFGGAFAEKAKTASVRVGYAAGPWRTAVVLPGSAKETAVVTKSDGAVVGFEVPIPSPAASQDIRVVAELESGIEEAATLVKNESGSLVAQFRGFKAEAVGEYRLESRPFRWLRFENISLSSGIATSCRVLRDSQGPLPIAAGQPSGSQTMFTVERGNSTGISARSTPSREELRYDGRSFRQWRRELLTELNPSRRAEAMRAFSAFGRNGYTKEAAGAILDATRQMRRVTASDVEEPSTQFRQAALTALLDLTPRAVVEVLAERMKTLKEENVDFIAAWLNTAASEERTGEKLRVALAGQLPVFLKAARETDTASGELLLKSLRTALPKDARLKN
jgi:beta-lactamase regulating signal transducer with metallopeptidase domain